MAMMEEIQSKRSAWEKYLLQEDVKCNNKSELLCLRQEGQLRLMGHLV